MATSAEDHGHGPTWSDIAAWYDDLVESGSGPHQTAVACTLRLAGDLSGLHLLDVACGTGLAARALAGAGAASVTAVDSSAAMLELAEGHERTHPLGITYVLDDAHALAALPDARFDGVTCQLGLMDIPDLEAMLQAVHRVLRHASVPLLWATRARRA